MKMLMKTLEIGPKKLLSLEYVAVVNKIFKLLIITDHNNNYYIIKSDRNAEYNFLLYK